jgi:flavin reductase (DIM6/NTAB) family NADH-FMN oxidoreductase RutF
MNIKMEDIDPLARYQLMIQTIIPRPVAWTLTENLEHNFNLAPFSYFNAIHSHPPMIMMSVGYKQDKSLKDTRSNIERTKKFVVHIASSSLAEKVTATSLAFDYGISELDKAGLSTVKEWSEFPLPRVKECKVAFACTLERVLEIGKNKQGLIFGEIEHMYLDDSIVDSRGGKIYVDAEKLDPIGRLGGDDYGTLGSILTVPRPEYKPY